MYLLSLIFFAAALVSATSTALCGFGGAIIFITIVYVAEATGLNIDPVTLITMSYFNNLVAVCVVFLQNPRQYVAHWQNALLLAPPITIGSVAGVIILSLISDRCVW